MSWWETDEDDEPEFDESSIRVRPNRKGNRPRTKTRPEHNDAETARVLAVDRGRYTVLLDEGTRVGAPHHRFPRVENSASTPSSTATGFASSATSPETRAPSRGS